MRYKLIGMLLLFMAFGCGKQNDYQTYYGEAQGTTFSIKYKAIEDHEDAIDSIFERMDYLFSTYIENSVVSRFNSSEWGSESDPDFVKFWEKCWELNIETNGHFDPTLLPVFSAYKKMQGDAFDSALIADALSHTGMPLISLEVDSMKKKDSLLKLGFDAVAQGYTVDVIRDFLLEKGIDNFMVEVGGEVYAEGFNDKGKTWTIGIDKPKEGERELLATVKLDGLSLATSGNYRKFTEIDGERFGHIINPKTGLPGYSTVLSVSVIAKDCYRADALATALMTMDSGEIRGFDNDKDDIHVILIELVGSDTSIYVSPEILETVELLDTDY